MVLDGNELEGKIGSGGAYTLDVKPDGTFRAEAKYGEGAVKGGAFVECDILEVLKAFAASTENKIDDSMVDMIKGALGR